MTSTDRHTSTGDPALLAAAARSVLACPSGVNLVVDGVDDVLGDLGTGPGEVGMQDLDGVPTFSCSPGSRLVQAATARRRALLTLESGLGRTTSVERDAVLTLGGHLERRGRETCQCCNEERETVVMVIDVVVLTRPQRCGDHVRVALDHFRTPTLVLNRGYLQRSSEHANLCHQDELRRAVASMTATRLAEVVGVSLSELSPTGVEVQWVDLEGSHRRRLGFPPPRYVNRRARRPPALGAARRPVLIAGLPRVGTCRSPRLPIGSGSRATRGSTST